MNDRSPLEVESTLIISSNDPEDVADRVAGLTSVAGFVLRHRHPLSIVDTYVDLSGRKLGRSGSGLRLRCFDDRALVTFKGPTREVDGARAREEFEDDWSADALEAVLARVRDLGVEISPTPFDGTLEPADVLENLGFATVQRRQLMRRPRDVLEDLHGVVLAELVVDVVTYRVGDRGIRHHEIEVEVKSEGGDTAVRRVTQAIIDMCGARVRPWPHGKFTTGRAVAALLASGKLDGAIDNGGRLQPGAYDLIAEWLSSE